MIELLIGCLVGVIFMYFLWLLAEYKLRPAYLERLTRRPPRLTMRTVDGKNLYDVKWFERTPKGVVSRQRTYKYLGWAMRKRMGTGRGPVQSPESSPTVESVL